MSDSIWVLAGSLLWSGWTTLLDYLAAHVLLCLVPAFVIAGYMTAMIPKEAVTRYLGAKASPWVSYPASAVGGFVLAVCSCTILPLFASIWKRGAGLGAAITFLFVGPAVNILAIAYTGAAIGLDIAIARIVLSLAFGVAIGVIMAWIFRDEEAARAADMPQSSAFDRSAAVRPAVWAVFVMLIAILIAGTLQLEFLTGAWLSVRLPIDLPPSLLAGLESVKLAPQGALLILLLAVNAPLAYLGLDRVLERWNGWTRLSMGAAGMTLLLAAPRFALGSLTVEITGRFVIVAALMAAIGVVAHRSFSREQIAEWLWEIWRFVKQIFPLLLAGVFLAGVVKAVIPTEWVRAAAGANTPLANLLVVLFAVFIYFPTLVEVPIARMFLDLGMHRGPLLAYLLADPELSLQSILVTGKIIGRQKTAIYVGLVTVFSSLAGYLFGLSLAALG